MNFSGTIILIAAIALAISLSNACSFFDAAPTVNPQTAEPTATNSGLPPENGAAKNAAATQPHSGKQTLPDDQRWRQAWALENLPPHAYAEFVRLRPGRVATTLTERCGEKACHEALLQAIDSQWDSVVSAAVRYDDTAAYDNPQERCYATRP